MQSKAANVTTYLNEIPIERRDCLNQLRELCLETLQGYQETMEYGMPCYKKGERAEVAFANQKNHIALYVMKENVVNANRQALAGLNVGKSCIKYSKPNKLDFVVIKKLLTETAESTEETC
jgi:uncharacterized protein YdhG (YjbR/CyaY superfamily)